jgi:UDP-N-acetylmuramoyl-tripeptide--D-alanyl-D-alanine ligase
MGDLDTVEIAEGEIFDGSVQTAVINADDERVVRQAELRTSLRLVRCSISNADADVCVKAAADGWQVIVAGVQIASLAELPGAPINIACAVGAAIELGIATNDIARRLSDLPVAPHRRTVGVGASGATVVDDTYNSNPVGAASALEHAARIATEDGKVILVTPGMVELGALQAAENERFGRAASAMCTHVLVVGRTNRAALVRGASRGEAEVQTFSTRSAAVQWVRDNASQGDVVLYENDLPDHYP